MRPPHLPLLFLCTWLPPCLAIRFVETDSFRGPPQSPQASAPPLPVYQAGSPAPPLQIFQENSRSSLVDPRLLPQPYVDSSEIRGGSISDSLQYSPLQFPKPLMYDQSNIIAPPGREAMPGGAPKLAGPTTPAYTSSLRRSDSGFFSLGDVDIGGEEQSSERNINIYHRSGTRDIEVYPNPGMVAPYAGHNVDPQIFSMTNYSGESIDVDMFEGVPGDERESHPGSINFSLLGQADPPPLLSRTDLGEHRQDFTEKPGRDIEPYNKKIDFFDDRGQMTASGDTTERWAEKMMQREYGETPPRRPVRVQEQGQGQDSWASKMMEREYGGSTEKQHNHPPVREYQATRRIQEEIEIDFVTPVSKVKKYAQTPRREFSKPPKEFSKPPRAFSKPPSESGQFPSDFSQFPSEFSQSPSEFSQPPREYNSLLPTQASLQDSVNFGLLISPGEGAETLECRQPARKKLLRGLKSILNTEMREDDDMMSATGVRIGLTVADACSGSEREALASAFILLTNSHGNSSLPPHLPTSDPRVLNVSRGEHLSEFTKALGKVGIRRYHTLSLQEVYNTQSLLRVLERKDVDTLIADIHGKDLEELVARLSGLASPASRFSWIFTSLLSSDMLVQVEQLLARTRVLSIFPVKNRKLLRATVKMKDNAAQVLAMETALPYLHMLRQLRVAYKTAWQQLCGGSRGLCPRLAQLQPRAFIRQYFNPALEVRQQSPASYMLIVYKSSSAEDFLDVEIQSPDPTTVRAVVSTVGRGTSRPHLIITETLSTIDMTKLDTTPATTTTAEILDSLAAASTTEIVVAETTASTTIRVATDATERMEDYEYEATETIDDYKYDENENMIDDFYNPLAECEESSACVIYLVEDEESRRAAWLASLLQLEQGPQRRHQGMSLGSALLSPRQLAEVALPSNLVATVTLDSVEKTILTEVHNFDIKEELQRQNSEGAMVDTVTKVLGEMVDNFGWGRIVLVYFNEGITRRVVDQLLASGKGCVTELVHLQLNYLDSPAFQRLLFSYSQGDAKVVLVAESPDQILYLMENIAEEVGWEPVKAAQQIAWAYLQTSGTLAQLAEDLPDISMYVLAESTASCDYCQDEQEEAVAKGVHDVMESVRSALALFSPACRGLKLREAECAKEFRGHLADSHQDNLSFNILRMNPDRIVDPEETLFILAGEFQEKALILYEGAGLASLEKEEGSICLNSTTDLHYQLQLQASASGHLESLWGSIALGVSIFGILIVTISGVYFIFTVNRKQKTEYGSVKDPSRLLHYMMIVGLVGLFCSPVPFLLRLSSVTCAFRAALPGIAFSLVLSSLLVNLVATWRKNIYTVNRQPHQASSCLCSPSAETPQSLLLTAILLAAVQATVTTVGIALRPPTPQLLDGHWRCDPGDSFQDGMVLLHSWLLLLTLAVLAMSVACLKYCATNRDAKWSLVSVIALVTVWAAWLALRRVLDFRYRDPVCVMALVVSALIVLLCIYARKLYEFTEFGKADTKLELMSNILLSESPTNSQPSYGTNILPHTIAMPEFEDNSILGESLYQHVNPAGRAYQEDRGPVDLSMFEQDFLHSSDENEPSDPSDQEGGSMPDLHAGDRSLRDREYNPEQIYHSISRGVSYKPMLKKIGSRKMLVLPNQHTLTHGSTSKI